MKRRLLLIVFISIVIILSLVIFLKHRADMIKSYNLSSATGIAVNFVVEKEFQRNYIEITTNSSYQKDAKKPSQHELIYELKGTGYLPVMEYLDFEPSSNTIVESYSSYSVFIQRVVLTNVNTIDDVFDESVPENPIFNSDGSFTFAITKEIPTESAMEILFYEFISSRNFDNEYYFYEYLYDSNQSIQTDVESSGVIATQDDAPLSISDLIALKDYIDSNKDRYYDLYYELTVSMIINEFAEYLNSIEVEDIETEVITYNLRVYKVKRKAETPDRFDLFVWAIDMVDFYEQVEGSNRPFVLN